MLNKINIAICDDEEIQVELLEKYVNIWAKRNNRRVNIEKFYSGDAFKFAWSMDKRYEILLLDIEMPGISGVDLARKIRKEDEFLKIIFITAIVDHIQEGYDVDAINYLIKPIEKEKLFQCLDRAIKGIPEEENWILIEDGGEIIRIREEDILFIESFSHNIEINTLSEKYSIRKNIGAMEKEVNQDLFIRIHRSYLVSVAHIGKIRRKEIELDNGKIIPLSRRRYKDVNMKFIEYFRGD